jgi:hypothetical protein
MPCVDCGGDLAAGFLCAPCDDKRTRARLAYFEGICPPTYREVEPRLLPRPQLFALVVDHWRNGEAPPHQDDPDSWGWDKESLILQGPARLGKTLTAFALLRRFTMDNDRPLFYPATVWAREVVRRSLNGELNDWLDRMSADDTHWTLFLDDLCKMKFTPKVSQVLYEVLEARFSRGMCVLVTLNASADELAARIPAEYSAPIVGRLKDFCNAVKFQ